VRKDRKKDFVFDWCYLEEKSWEIFIWWEIWEKYWYIRPGEEEKAEEKCVFDRCYLLKKMERYL